jgi:hypothetical protein
MQKYLSDATNINTIGGILPKRIYARPGWCNLCQNVEETNAHIIMTCPFTKEVWKEVENMILKSMVC